VIPSIFNSRIVQCGSCGSDVALATAPEAREIEPPDFDTRPGETMRSTLPLWVQHCPACHYCAAEITMVDERAVGLIGSADYQRIVHDSSLPPKAREFLAYSLILDSVDQPADAGWSALHAAWSCDDAGDESAATRCRAKALELWQKSKARGEDFGDELALEFIIITDVNRRMGEWADAVVACSEALDSEDLSQLYEDILRHEKSLIDRKDRSAHSLKELPPFSEQFSMEIQ
jgi:hypothetical protein